MSPLAAIVLRRIEPDGADVDVVVVSTLEFELEEHAVTTSAIVTRSERDRNVRGILGTLPVRMLGSDGIGDSCALECPVGVSTGTGSAVEVVAARSVRSDSVRHSYARPR